MRDIEWTATITRCDRRTETSLYPRRCPVGSAPETLKQQDPMCKWRALTLSPPSAQALSVACGWIVLPVSAARRVSTVDEALKGQIRRGTHGETVPAPSENMFAL